MLKKHLAPALLLCAGLLLSACGAAEAPGSAQSLSADLDGDGQEETVEYSVFSPEGAPGSRCSLSIDGVSVDESLAEQGFNAVNVHAECAAVDLDSADGYVELAVLEDGQSADYYTNFIRFDGEGAVYLGRVPGLIGDTGYFPVTVNGRRQRHCLDFERRAAKLGLRGGLRPHGQRARARGAGLLHRRAVQDRGQGGPHGPQRLRRAR